MLANATAVADEDQLRGRIGKNLPL